MMERNSNNYIHFTKGNTIGDFVFIVFVVRVSDELIYTIYTDDI